MIYKLVSCTLSKRVKIKNDQSYKGVKLKNGADILPKFRLTVCLCVVVFGIVYDFFKDLNEKIIS